MSQPVWSTPMPCMLLNCELLSNVSDKCRKEKKKGIAKTFDHQ